MIKNWQQYNENKNEQELETMFNLVIGHVEVFKMPYSYYGDSEKSRDFDIYLKRVI